MLTGTLAGQYVPEQMQIDLARRCAETGARWILGETVGLDRQGKRLLLRDAPDVRYDLLSIGIGSRPQPVDGGERGVSIKPMQTFVARLQSKIDPLVSRGASRVKIAVVGGGAGGVEVALCVPAFVQRQWPGAEAEMTVVHSGDRLLTGGSQRAQRAVERIFSKRKYQLLLMRRAVHLEENGTLQLVGDAPGPFRLPADVVIWATSAVGPTLFERFDLPRDDRGFLLVDKYLRCAPNESIFAVGDSATCRERPYARSGVYAVRQGPVLWHNLRAALGSKPLREWKPQRDFLRLLNTGDGRALMDYRGIAMHARWCWHWKDFLDRRFMRQHGI